MSKYRNETDIDKKKAIAKTGAKVMEEIDRKDCYTNTFELIVGDDILLRNYVFTRTYLW